MGGGTAVQAPGFDGQFITGNQGLVLGTVQTSAGSHSGAPDGSENPTIDNPWLFFGNTGMHGTLSPTIVLSASGNTSTIDFSGWSLAWNGLDSSNGISPLKFETGAWFGTTTDGVAQITCGIDCGDGDSYTLIFSGVSFLDPLSNLNGSRYLLNLTGTISAVPVPAAVWLFGSGLLGLVGVARCRKAV